MLVLTRLKCCHLISLVKCCTLNASYYNVYVRCYQLIKVMVMTLQLSGAITHINNHYA